MCGIVGCGKQPVQAMANPDVGDVEGEMGLLRKIRGILIYCKVCMQRTMSWMAMINSAMIVLLVLSEFGISVKKWAIPIYIAAVVIMVIVGIIEDRAGFHREEMRTIAERNPYFLDIMHQLKEIKRRLF